MTKLNIIIVSYNTKVLTLACLGSIFNNPPIASFSVTLVDNNSADNTVSAVKNSYPKVKVIASKENLGFGRGNNLGIKENPADYYLLLNSDTKVSKGAIDKLLSFSQKTDLGIASCKLINSDATFQPNAGQLPNPVNLLLWLSGIDDLMRQIYPIESYQEIDVRHYYEGKLFGWVSGSVMLIKNEILLKTGLFDEKIFMYAEDVDLCWRANKAGYKIGWTDQATICHLGGGSSKEPKYNQWKGEFAGLIYLYNKYYGSVAALLLRIVIMFFVLLRVIAFFIIGKYKFSQTYVKVAANIR